MLFTSAFDDAFVYRYNQNDLIPESKIDVRYVHGPKHRVIHDIINKDKVLTLPVVTIEQTDLVRDPSRVVNKHQNIYRPLANDYRKKGKLPTPVPVNIGVKVSIIAKYKEDIDQIVQNFAVNCNPYIVVSWKVPDEFKFDFQDELRMQIEWSQQCTYTTPAVLAKDDKYRITADTNFTIKGWLFPSTENPEGVIYVVDSNFINANLAAKLVPYDDYPSLSASYVESETMSISAYPSFTNLFYTVSGDSVMLLEPTNISKSIKNSFLLLGKRFDYNNNWYLSSGDLNFYTNFQEISTAKGPVISAFRLPSEYVTVFNDNAASISIPTDSISANAPFTFVTSNSASWTYWHFNLTTVD